MLRDDGEKLQCHICGGWYTGLDRHAWGAHDLLAREYKSIFGLNLTAPLIGVGMREKLRQQGEWLRKTYGPPPRVTPEQASSGYTARPRSKQFSRENRERHLGVPQKRANTTGYIGVGKRGTKWIAQMGSHGAQRYIGMFATPEAAARAYDAKAKELYGDRAILNFPDDGSL